MPQADHSRKKLRTLSLIPCSSPVQMCAVTRLGSYYCTNRQSGSQLHLKTYKRRLAIRETTTNARSAELKEKSPYSRCRNLGIECVNNSTCLTLRQRCLTEDASYITLCCQIRRDRYKDTEVPRWIPHLSTVQSRLQHRPKQQIGDVLCMQECSTCFQHGLQLASWQPAVE